MVIWTGAAVHGTVLAFFLVMSLIGIDPDDSTAKFFMTLAPFIFVFGIILNLIAFRLAEIWNKPENRGAGYAVNRVFTFLLCDFSVPPTLFFIAMPFLSLISLGFGIEEWIRVGL